MKTRFQPAILALALIFFIPACKTGTPKNSSLPVANVSGANLGELILTNFSTAPFPHPGRAQGHNYKTNIFPAEKHYRDNTVEIFIPKHFRVKPKIDFVVHFHGWHNNVTNVLRQYELPQQLVASGKNAILIVPQGPRNAPDSFGGKLEDADGFKRFMDEAIATFRIEKRFRKAEIGKIILSGHSGGYQVISAILDVGGLTEKVKEVWLFDALYARTDKFRNWFEHSGGRFIDLYTANGGTKSETEKLMSNLKQTGKSFLADQESTIADQQLRENRIIFLFTDLPHDEVLNRRRTFFKFLQTSSLESF